MGLISWIKDAYYNHKLDNADSAYYQLKDIHKAEGIYLELLDKHPDTAEHLARMYYYVAISDKDELTYLNKLKSLQTKTSNETEAVSSYLLKLVSHIEEAADLYFKNCDYNKAYKYLKSIELDKKGDTLFAKKNRLYALYVNLNAVEFDSSYATSLALIDTFCKKNTEQDIEDAIISTVKRLREAKKSDRAYCVSNCLASKGNVKAIKECVAIAYDIYKSGKTSYQNVIDEDALLDYISQTNPSNLLDGLKQFAIFSDKIRNKYVALGLSVISHENDNKKGFALFRDIWETTPDVSLIHEFANPASTISFSVYEYFAKDTNYLTLNSIFSDALIQELITFKDYNYVLSILEKFKKKGIDVEGAYINKAKSIYNFLDENTRLVLINRVLSHFSHNTWAIDEKMIIGKKFQKEKKYISAKRLYSELVDLHADAQPKLAQLFFEQSQSEIDFTKKRNLIIKAFEFKTAHSSLFNFKKYNNLIPYLSSAVIELIRNRFSSNDPDEAYNTANIFKHVSNCFEQYIQELKKYKDVNYILFKLESLKKDGFDVESDYKKIVSRIVSSIDYDNKYKLKVLSRSIDLYEDEYLSEKFIQVAIDVIKNENDSVNAVSVFGSTWKQLPDSKLLVEFVNQNYIYHAHIIDYLIEKSQITRLAKSLLADMCDQIFSFDNYRYSLVVFERLIRKGIAVKKAYVATILKALPSLSINDRLSLINEGLAKYQDKYLINEKLGLSDSFANEGYLDIAETILHELVGLHEMAEPKLAMLFYEESKKSKVLDTKLCLITKGLAYHISHSPIFAYEEYNSIFKKLLSSYTILINKYYPIDKNKAYQLCVELKQYNDKWYLKYICIRAVALSEIENPECKIDHIRKTFMTLETEGYDLKETTIKEVNSLWDILSIAEVNYAKTCTYKDRIQHLNDYSNYVASHCNKEKGNTILKDINTELVAIHKIQGYNYEQEGLYSNAIESYSALSSISDVRTKSWSRIRCALCNIKSGKTVKEEDVRKLLAYVGFAKEKKELSYRYSLYLIKNNGAKQSITFIEEFLPNEIELIDICKNKFIKESEFLLSELNQIIEKLNKGIAHLSEAKKLLDSLDNYDEKISPYLEGIHQRIVDLRPLIQSYILSKWYEEGHYEDVLSYLKNSGKNWYEDDVYFRNIAIACLGIAESGKISKINYKAIISYWLTAVYCDRLFINSLEYTSWDDAYTFTLYNSLGGSKDDSFEALPDNVNFDEPQEGSVISIAEVQQNLLNRFETALNDKDETFRNFYDEQKNAMDSLVKLNLDKPCIIAAPYLANNTRKCFNEIKDTLSYEYDNYGSENILKVGVLYNINYGTFKEYKVAMSNADSCMSAAKSMSITHVKKAFTNSAIESIQEFPDLYNSFTTEIQNILSREIKNNTSYKTILNVFSIICLIAKESTLSYIFGNYINQCVVAKLNDNSLDLASGLKDLVSAYNVAKSYLQLKNNIGSVLEALVRKYITESNSGDLDTIKYVLNSTGTEFESNVANILSDQIVLIAMATGHAETIDSLAAISAKTAALRNKLTGLKNKKKEISLNMELSKVVDSVNNNKMSYSSALQKVYSLYKENKDNSRVCENLCTLIGMCIREYVIPDIYEKSTVMPIFNELKYNKSATYKVSAEILRKERQGILDSLPWEARNLLTGGTAYGSSLNENGIKLRNALQLYLDLA